MEKERLLVNETDGGGTLAWNSSIFMIDNPPSELNCSSELLSDCFFSSSWDPSSMDRNDPFESALSSMVSSPVASAVGACDGFVIRELIGRLGGISDSGEISPHSRNVGSTNASSYNTPLNSPPKLNLSPVMESRIQGISQFSGSQLPHFSHPSLAPLTADPGFAERAARFSCFGGRNLAAGLAAAPFRPEFGHGSFPELEPGKLSRVSSNQSLKVAAGFQVGAQEKVNSFPTDEKLRQISPVRGEMGDSREGSSVSELNPGGRAHNDNNNCRKRKLNTKARTPAKEEKKVARDNENAKRIKHGEDAKKKNMNENCNSIDENGKSAGVGDEKQHKSDNNNNSNIKESAKPAPEPPKDYIHVRARRGQATDSHSLAERVRREKISERMKFLQDLVPGCNKVTGKAVVLDEIINYVQSLQRQVEFLSMKLASVNPEMEFNMEALLSKDSFHSRGSLPPSSMYRGVDSAIAAPAFPYSYQSMPNAYNGGSENPFPVPLLNNSIQRTQMGSVDGFSDSASQVPAFGGGDLHSVIQMSIAQNQTENLEGTKPTACMKVEL